MAPVSRPDPNPNPVEGGPGPSVAGGVATPSAAPERTVVLERTAAPKRTEISCAPALVFGFERGQTSLATPDITATGKFVQWLEDRPDAEVVVEAHASADGSPTHNLRVSHARGQSVRRMLVTHGMVPASITIQAYGEYRPSVSGGDDADRRAVVRVVGVATCDEEAKK